MEKYMNITTYGHTVEVTDALREHIESQFNKLEKFSSYIQSVNVTLEVRAGIDHTAKCTIKVPHHKDIHAESTSNDMYGSIDSLSLKLEQQLRKIKSIKESSVTRNTDEPEYEEAESDDEE